MRKLAFALIVAFALAGPAFTQQPSPQDANAKAAASVRVRGYSLVLLLGDTQGSSVPEGLSAPAKKALADIKDFLPYKSFRVIDTQWIAGTESGGMSSGRLRGLEENTFLPYSLTLSRFQQGFKLFTADGRTLLLDTAFTERPGETVVVGTSRVQGDRALVVLFSIVTDSEVFVPGNGVVAPVALKMAKPVYTQEALKQRIAGEAVVSFIVRADGSVTDAEVTRSLDPTYGLDAQAIKAVQASEFKPGTKDGKPVDVRINMQVTFTTR